MVGLTLMPNNKGCFAADAAKRQEPANTPLVEQARIKPLI